MQLNTVYDHRSIKFFSVLICVILMGGRWITNFSLGIYPLLDILCLITLVWIGISKSYGRKFSVQSLFWLICLLATLIRVFQILISFDNVKISDVLRDSQPFVLIFLAMFVGSTTRIPIYVFQRQLKSILFAALVGIGLSLFSFFATNNSGFDLAIPFLREGVKPFSVRNDFMAIPASAAISLLYVNLSTRFLYRRRMFVAFAILSINSIILILFGVRSVILALFFVNVICFSLYARREIWRFLVLTPILILLTYLFISLAQLSDLVSYYSNRFWNVFQGPVFGKLVSDENALGQGTAIARVETWKSALNYLSSDWLMNVNFGLNPLELGFIGDSLGVSGEVRAPHNFILTLLLRFGIVFGSVIAIAFAIFVLGSFLPRRQNSDFENIAFVCVIGIITVSCFGVILDSPFGYIPFSYFVFALLALERSREKCPRMVKLSR